MSTVRTQITLSFRCKKCGKSHDVGWMFGRTKWIFTNWVRYTAHVLDEKTSPYMTRYRNEVLCRECKEGYVHV